MFDLNLSEEFDLPVSLDQSHQICERALMDLKWSIREQSPTTLVAQEGGIMKWISNPNDVCIFLSQGDKGTQVRLNATWAGGRTTGKLLQPVLQGKINKIRARIDELLGGRSAVPPPLPGSTREPAASKPPPTPSTPAGNKDHIFISYRRSDSADVTGRIRDRLVGHFGEGSVFQDVEDIPLGMDFAESIQQVVGKCDAFLAIIGDDWLGATDDSGARRLDNSADYVRIEVESALSRKIPLIPVLVQNAEMPSAEALPDSLRKLATRNATRARANPDFQADITRLIEGLEELFQSKA